MKRFILFAGDKYYPLGGMQDMKGSYDSLKEILEALPDCAPICGYGWAHGWDRENSEFVFFATFDPTRDWTVASTEKELKDSI